MLRVAVFAPSLFGIALIMTPIPASAVQIGIGAVPNTVTAVENVWYGHRYGGYGYGRHFGGRFHRWGYGYGSWHRHGYGYWHRHWHGRWG